jgi:DNA-binding PadR family transcriptional regulator
VPAPPTAKRSARTPELRELTELEGSVLGVVWEQGPCTAYVIRKVFVDSPSPYWSGSAGAVYPLLARLERRGLVRSRAHRVGRRASRRFAVTPPGLRQLKRWLGPPFADWILGVPMDPLRTRLSFLAALPAAQRAAFLAEAEKKVLAYFRLAKREVARTRADSDVYSQLVAKGVLGSLRARLAWLRAARRGLSRSR